MARIAGVDLPKNKRGVIGLTYIYGIGPTTAKNILVRPELTKAQKLTNGRTKILKRFRGSLPTRLRPKVS